MDDAFDAVDAEQLRAGGFCRIESFPEHFKRDDGGKEQGVKDPRVLRLCNARKWLLVTTDSDLRHTHVEVIKSLPDLAILATAHNNVADVNEWINGLIGARARIEREFKKRQRPWFAQFNRQGAITTIYTLTEMHCSRRVRPLEQ